ESLLAGLRRVGHAGQRLALDLAVPHVGLLVDRKEAGRVAFLDPVEGTEAFALGLRDLGDLRLVRVERRQAFRRRALARRATEFGDSLGPLGSPGKHGTAR